MFPVHQALQSSHVRTLRYGQNPEKVPPELEALHSKLGILEESADVLGELYTLAAIRKGLLPSTKQLGQWKDNLSRFRTEKKSFHDFLRHIIRNVPKEKAQALMPILGMDEQACRTLLALLICKYIFLSSENANYDIETDTFQHFVDEAAELAEHMEKHSSGKDITYVTTASRALRGKQEPSQSDLFKQFRIRILDLANSMLGLDLSFDTLLKDFWFNKLISRHSEAYRDPDSNSESRKKISKPRERNLEFDLLTWHSQSNWSPEP